MNLIQISKNLELNCKLSMYLIQISQNLKLYLIMALMKVTYITM